MECLMFKYLPSLVGGLIIEFTVYISICWSAPAAFATDLIHCHLLQISKCTYKAKIFYGCEGFVFHGFDVYPIRTFRYTYAPKLGWYDIILMKLADSLTD